MNLQQQLELRIEQEISVQLESMIEDIEGLADRFFYNKEDEKSAFKNVLTAASDVTASLKSTQNYIRYQLGRKGAAKIWKRQEKNGSQRFAEAVVNKLDSVKKDSDEIVTRIKDALKESPKNADNACNQLSKYLEENEITIQRELYLRLIRLYLGYLSREHTARLKPK